MARRKWWKRYRGWIAIAVFAAIGIAVYLFVHSSAPAAQGTTYTTEQAANGTLSVTVAGAGNLAVRDAVEVWPKSSGTVASIDAVLGKWVSKGAVLYTLEGEAAARNTAQALAQRKQAWESVTRAELSVTQAKNQLATLESQAAKPNSKVTSSQIKAAEQQVSAANAGLSSAYASYDSAKLAYTDAVEAETDLIVKAPVSGRVWSVSIAKGDSVSSSGGGSGTGATGTDPTSSGSGSTSTAPVVIAAGGKLGAQLAINEVDIPTVKVGQDAELTFDALPDLTLAGTVDKIDRDGTVTQGVVTYNVWVTLNGADKQLKTGMSTAATIVTAVARNVLLVPNASIKTGTSGSYVQVMKAGASTPIDVAVETGLAGSTQTVITSGIKAGDVVVTKTVTAGSTSSGTSNSRNSDRGGGFGGPGFSIGGGPPGAGQ